MTAFWDPMVRVLEGHLRKWPGDAITEAEAEALLEVCREFLPDDRVGYVRGERLASVDDATVRFWELHYAVFAWSRTRGAFPIRCPEAGVPRWEVISRDEGRARDLGIAREVRRFLDRS